MNGSNGSQSTVIIAEIGVNHNGSLDMAKQLVRACAEAGADYAKFQTFSAKALASREAPVADYQAVGFAGRNQQDLLGELELSESDFGQLVQECDAAHIGFLTTAHDLPSARFVFELGLDFIKVPSGDVTNYPFLRLAGSQGKRILLSTGASTANEVGQALGVLESTGLPREKITVMQCTTEYPAPSDEANLQAMLTMGSDFGVAIGFSDHTLGLEATIAAVAMGATVIEKHITLDRAMRGPDHAASLEPHDFGDLVAGVRHIEVLKGKSEKFVTSAESKNRSVIRKSIVAAKPILEGEVFSEANLTVMRPGSGLSPMEWPDILGKPASRNFRVGEMIEL